jgi:hypothetical protein
MQPEISHSRKRFEEPTIKYLRDFILDKGVSDNDSIAFDERMFDELTLDFRNSYDEPIPEPFIFLGVWIKIADRGALKPNQALIIQNDPAPIPNQEVQNNIRYEEVPRCGWCGKLLDEHGDELMGDKFEVAMSRHKRYGEGIWMETTGNCCMHREG